MEPDQTQVITVTSIRLKSIWKFFPLSLYAMRILKQTKLQPGFVAVKTRGVGYNHYTISVWQTEQDMHNFKLSGAHKEAMKL